MILEELPVGADMKFVGFVESCYVKSLRSIGHKLTNENDGGWGGSNGPHTLAYNAELTAELGRVRKVVAEPAPPPDDPNVVRVAGIPGGKLKVQGTNLGTEKGTVRLNGVEVEVTDWSPTVISGRIPHDVVDGEVVVTSKDGKARKGKFIR